MTAGSIVMEVLWNAFEKMAAEYSEAAKDSIFRGTATRVYKRDSSEVQVANHRLMRHFGRR